MEMMNYRTMPKRRRRDALTMKSGTIRLLSLSVIMMGYVLSSFRLQVTGGSKLPWRRRESNHLGRLSRFYQLQPKEQEEELNKNTILSTRAGSTATMSAAVATTATGFFSNAYPKTLQPLSYYLRIALAGGLAGATGSAVLYPIDSAKTLRQSNPKAYSSVRDALLQMLHSKNALRKIYKGILPAALGAIPSSALYFGAYESSKVMLQTWAGSSFDSSNPINQSEDCRSRLAIHGLAAASGNIISSIVFVPKEVIKQQLQIRTSVLGEGTVQTIGRIVQSKGIRGLYTGYGATLLRNIPSATIRFVLYEELKRQWTETDANFDGNHDPTKQKFRAVGSFLAGAVAGSTSSFVMTPIDVVKTRMATGSCPLGVKSCMLHVLQETGYKGLYAGAGSRVLWSGAFSAIGFGTFELVKGYLGVSSASALSSMTQSKNRRPPRSKRENI